MKRLIQRNNDRKAAKQNEKSGIARLPFKISQKPKMNTTKQIKSNLESPESFSHRSPPFPSLKETRGAEEAPGNEALVRMTQNNRKNE